MRPVHLLPQSDINYAYVVLAVGKHINVLAASFYNYGGKKHIVVPSAAFAIIAITLDFYEQSSQSETTSSSSKI